MLRYLPALGPPVAHRFVTGSFWSARQLKFHRLLHVLRFLVVGRVGELDVVAVAAVFVAGAVLG